MNKYVLMLAASALIAAAPAYYAFQAQAEEADVPGAKAAVSTQNTNQSAEDQQAATQQEQAAPEAAAAGQEPAAGEPAPAPQVGNQ